MMMTGLAQFPLAHHPGDWLIFVPVVVALAYVVFENVRQRRRRRVDEDGGGSRDQESDGPASDLPDCP